jgi:hypothetical protein
MSGIPRMRMPSSPPGSRSATNRAAIDTISRRDAVFHPDVDVGLAHPVPGGLFGDSEVSSDLGDAQIAPTSDDDVSLNSAGNFFGMVPSFQREAIALLGCGPDRQKTQVPLKQPRGRAVPTGFEPVSPP